MNMMVTARRRGLGRINSAETETRPGLDVGCTIMVKLAKLTRRFDLGYKIQSSAEDSWISRHNVMGAEV